MVTRQLYFLSSKLKIHPTLGTLVCRQYISHNNNNEDSVTLTRRNICLVNFELFY